MVVWATKTSTLLTVSSCPPSGNSLFGLLCNVWAIKNQCSLLDLYSNVEEVGDDHLCVSSRQAPWWGGTAFWPVFWEVNPNSCSQS